MRSPHRYALPRNALHHSSPQRIAPRRTASLHASPRRRSVLRMEGFVIYVMVQGLVGDKGRIRVRRRLIVMH
jgi:hypothetical protein